MKQTAVQWLVEQLPIRIVNSYQSEIVKVLEMEKQQIRCAIHEANRSNSRNVSLNSEQYYNEIYK